MNDDDDGGYDDDNDEGNDDDGTANPVSLSDFKQQFVTNSARTS